MFYGILSTGLIIFMLGQKWVNQSRLNA